MKRILAMLLAMLTMIPLLVACQDASGPAQQTTDAATTEPAETDPFDHGVPKTDYKEREFLISAPWPDHWGKDSYNVEEDSGDSIVSAIYKRNREVESYFNITIQSRTDGYTHDQFEKLQPQVLSNTDKVDMVAVGFYQSGKQMITMDLIRPFNDVKYINLDKDWWDKGVTDTLSILDNYYYLVGDVNWYYMPETAVCYFNKVVAAKYEAQVGDLYETVRDHEWTMDKLADVSKNLSVDNGDGKWDDKDQYAAIQNEICGQVGFFFAADIRTVQMKDDGPKLSVMTERMQTLINKAGDYIAKNNTSYNDRFDFSEDSEGVRIFFDNRALFFFDILLHASDFRDEESDFGLIPYPKLDEKQKNYSTYANQWSLSCAMPVTASDPNRTGAILEVLSCKSREYIVPAYYEKTLMGKIKRDDESEEMLNIIFENVLYDFGMCYAIGSIPLHLIQQGQTNLSSWYRRSENQIFNNAWDLYAHVYKTTNGVEPEKPANR